MRLLVHTDYIYRRDGETVYAERAFALFLAAIAGHVTTLSVAGRLDTAEGALHYPMPDTIEFVALPHYDALTDLAGVTRSLAGSLLAFWRALDGAERVWLLGPQPHAVIFALLTLMRRRTLVLGVRQDFPAYMRMRHPRRRVMHLAGSLLEAVWRVLALRCAVVTVGSYLGSRYAHAPRLLEVVVSLIRDEDVAAGQAAQRRYDGELQLLSVGRIDAEKNPLLLADTLALLREQDDRWRLVVCGDGPLRAGLAERIDALGLREAVELRGYIPFGDDLMGFYRSSHAFLHVSWTDAVPQVLAEAFAAGLPVVATAVGGVAGAVGDAALLIAPGNAAAAAQAVGRVVADASIRERLVDRGFEQVLAHTLDAETARIAKFIAG